MKDIFFYETPWETRNLGMPSYAMNEISSTNISYNDILREIEYLCKIHDRFFIFARIPQNYLKVSSILEKIGFYIVECTVIPMLNLNKSSVLEEFNKDNSIFIPKKFKKENINFISLSSNNSIPVESIKNIAEESFTRDRFHIDHNCTDDIANRRFTLWVEDIIFDSSCKFDILTLDESIIAFMARKKNNLLLAGFKKTYTRSGLGSYLWLNTCNTLKDKGYRTAETLISINNMPVLNLYSRLGFKFKDTRYSLHYWNNNQLSTVKKHTI